MLRAVRAKRNKFWNPAVAEGDCLKCAVARPIRFGVPRKVWGLKLAFFMVEVVSACAALLIFDESAAAIALFAGAAMQLLDLLLEGGDSILRRLQESVVFIRG